MKMFLSLKRHVRKRLIAFLGLSKEVTGHYYPQQPTCQVPYVWSLFSLFLGEREDGYFVEVGAYDGIFASNTWGLSERQWAGLMIEPIPHLAKLCRESHRKHPRVKVVEHALGPVDSAELKLHLAGTLTTANTELFEEYAGVSWAKPALTPEILVVPSQTLNTLLVTHEAPTGFDVLVVDVEGFEAEVFSGFDLDRWRPKMMIVELADTHPDLVVTAESDARLGVLIEESGYRLVFKDHINTVFVRYDIWEKAYEPRASFTDAGINPASGA